MITPIGKRVAIERLPKRKESAIETPDAYDTPSQLGKVVSLGTGAPDFEFTVKPGETVLLPELYQPGEYVDHDTTLIIMRESNLLGILDEPKPYEETAE